MLEISAAFPFLTQVGEIDFPQRAHIFNGRSGASAMISLTNSTRTSLRWHHKILQVAREQVHWRAGR